MGTKDGTARFGVGAAGKDTAPTKGVIKTIGTGKFILVPRKAVVLAERPQDGEAPGSIFFNPRSIRSFTQERMLPLRTSIQCEGIQQPPLLRATTNDKGEVTWLGLIAGERRFRSMDQCAELDLPCFDEDTLKPEKFRTGAIVVSKGVMGRVVSHAGRIVTVERTDGDKKLVGEYDYDDVFPTVSGRKLYEYIPAKLMYNVSDERALRLAFQENDEHCPLTIEEEIALVERLLLLGKSYNDIVEMLGTNITWVSQTASFRRELPTAAFQKLISGQMARNVAVNFLSFEPEHREPLFLASVKAEEEMTKSEIDRNREDQIRYEDEAELIESDAEAAENTEAAERLRAKARAAQNKADKAKERRQRAENGRGSIKASHVKAGAAAANIAPRKAKMLDASQAEELYVKGLFAYATNDLADPVTGQVVPSDYASIARRVALAIKSGCTDPIQPIREYMVENGRWAAPPEPSDELPSSILRDCDFEEPPDDPMRAVNLHDDGEESPKVVVGQHETEAVDPDFDTHDKDWN